QMSERSSTVYSPDRTPPVISIASRRGSYAMRCPNRGGGTESAASRVHSTPPPVAADDLRRHTSAVPYPTSPPESSRPPSGNLAVDAPPRREGRGSGVPTKPHSAPGSAAMLQLDSGASPEQARIVWLSVSSTGNTTPDGPEPGRESQASGAEAARRERSSSQLSGTRWLSCT